jgi:hypothetical protein
MAASAQEQRMVINGVSWQDYVILREALDFALVATLATRPDQDAALHELAALVR